MADHWTILACPKCGKQVYYSPMDAAHGFEPMCGCTSAIAEDEEGITSVQGGTPPVAVTVVPALENWRDAARVPDGR
jgi:hypothetical protein